MTVDTRPLRADAERNRVRIVVAAREVFARQGLDVTLDEIARHAGVGVGTVYRRFAGKDALVMAVFDHALAELVELIDDCARDDDAWAGLSRLMTGMAQRQAADRGLMELCTRADFGRVERVAAHFVPAVDVLVARGKRNGTLRPDLDAADIGPMMHMVMASAEFTVAAAPDLWRRYLALLLDGIRVGGHQSLPVSAPTHEQMYEAFRAMKS